MSVSTDPDDTDVRVVDDEIGAMPSVPSLRPRRRPWLLPVGTVLIAVSGLAAAMLYLGADERTEVLALANDVSYGQELTREDLVTVRVALDPAVESIPAEQLPSILGRPVSARLAKGELLTQANLRADIAPGKGSRLVAVPLHPGQVPARGLRPGDVIDIVSTPGEDGEIPDDSSSAITGTVVRVDEPAAAGMRVVDVEVPADDGTSLAVRAATGDIAVVLKPVALED